MKFFWDKETIMRMLSNIVVVLIGIAFYFLLANWGQIHAGFGTFSSLIKPFVIGFAIAYLLSSPVNYFERKVLVFMDRWPKVKRLKRAASILITMLLTCLLIGALLSVVLPQLFESAWMLVNNIPIYITSLEQWTQQFMAGTGVDISAGIYQNLLTAWENYVNTASVWLMAGIQSVVTVTGQVTSAVLDTFVAIIVAIYLLNSKELFFAQIKKVLNAFLPQQAVQNAVALGRLTNRTFNGFINGKLIDSAIIGVLCFICLQLMNMPYALLVSVIVGVTNIIPFFGPFIGAIPSTFIILIAEPIKAVWFLIFILLLQQFDGNILGPKILGNSTGLPAIWVLFAILIGGGLAGFIGMIVGVPTFAVLYTLFKEYLNHRLNKRGLSQNTDDYWLENNQSKPS